MNADAKRSNRLNQLLRMALNGSTSDQLYSKALTWGVTEQTAKSYIRSVEALLKTKGKRQ